MELFSEWCGPCMSVLPTFKRLRLEKDDEACLKFLKVLAHTKLSSAHTVLPRPGMLLALAMSKLATRLGL